jgi:hypothetical protein
MNLHLPELRGPAPRGAPLALEYRKMVAILAAAQAASPTATAEAMAPPIKPHIDGDATGALVALLSGNRLQDRQAEALAGSFSPEAARYASNRYP